MADIGSPSHPATTASVVTRRCVFCQEAIQIAAIVCPHCNRDLEPLQTVADKSVSLANKVDALEERILMLEQMLAVQPLSAAEADLQREVPPMTPGPSISGVVDLKWPHMLDNILLGIAALLAAHWLATTTPAGNRAALRVVALVVALPFGFRFQKNARARASAQVVAALSFASFGTLMIGLLDMLIQGGRLPPATTQDLAASLAAIALSHYAGSALADLMRVRKERKAADLAAQIAVSDAANAHARLHLEPARIKTTADAIKATFDAATPIMAAGAALWAAVGHLFF